jgi:hypothetical protein
LVILPADDGAVAVIVNAAVPVDAPDASPDDKVTAQLNSAPADDGNVPQLTALTPVPAVTAVATTPAGNWSSTVVLVPEVEPPPLPSPNV